MNGALKKKKWDVLRILSEIVERPEGKRFDGRRCRSNAIMFLEALGMIQGGGTHFDGKLYKITPLGKEILKGHITKALLGE